MRLGTNTGALAAAAWLAARDITSTDVHWSVQLVLDNTPGGELDLPPLDARFAIEIFAEEWGFSFTRGPSVSWIRVTDIPFVHGRDDFALLRRTPRLENIGLLMRALEVEHDIVFMRDVPIVRSSIGSEDRIAAWARGL